MAFEIEERKVCGINTYSVYEEHDHILVMHNFLKFPNYMEALEELEKAQNWDEQFEIAACDYFPDTKKYRLYFYPKDSDKYEPVWIETVLQQNEHEHVTLSDVLKQVDRDGEFARIIEEQEEKYLQAMKEEDAYRYMVETESFSW